jgi:site-specific recombinase XerD
MLLNALKTVNKLIPTGTGSLAGSVIQPELDLLTTYLQRYDRAHTVRSYRADLADFFGTELITLDDARAVTFVHVNKYLAALEQDGLKPATLRRRVASIRGFFDWLVALGVLSNNPAARHVVRRIRGGGRRDRSITFLTDAQAGALIDAADDGSHAAIRNQALIQTLLYCVLRRSEAAAMDVEHVRPLGPYWVLDLPETKGGADQYVKVPDHLVETLDRMRAHYGITSGPMWRSFSRNSEGKRLSAHWIYRIVCDTAARAGIGGTIGAHTLRHTGCTLAIESGASLQQVQAHARHKQLETTMIYVHQRDRLRDSAADFIRVPPKKG